MSDLLSAILSSLPDGRMLRVLVGRRWAASVVRVQGAERCGLAAAWRLRGEAGVELPSVEDLSAREWAAGLRSARGLQASLAAATINALLPPLTGRWKDEKLEDVIRARGAGKRVAMVGHFPFVDALRPRVGSLAVLEERPRPGDLPASAAPDVIPKAEVVVITGMAFVNRTLDSLLRLCAPGAHVIVAGPSTPLSPILFEYGVHELCGCVVQEVEAVLRAVEAGEGFHGVHRAGVQLVTIAANVSS